MLQLGEVFFQSHGCLLRCVIFLACFGDLLQEAHFSLLVQVVFFRTAFVTFMAFIGLALSLLLPPFTKGAFFGCPFNKDGFICFRIPFLKGVFFMAALALLLGAIVCFVFCLCFKIWINPILEPKYTE